MLLSEVVDTSAAVAATRSRLAKVKALSALLRSATADVVVAVVSFLIGTPRQGRIGTGWRTVLDLSVPPAPHAELTIAEVDAALAEVATTSGKGSAQRRVDLLTALFKRSTEAEQDFLRRLLTGELRQGALEGVMADAIASASGAAAPVVRRAAMLSGDLARAGREQQVGDGAGLRGARPRARHPRRGGDDVGEQHAVMVAAGCDRTAPRGDGGSARPVTMRRRPCCTGR